MPLSNVNYHVTALADEGLVELFRERGVRGRDRALLPAGAAMRMIDPPRPCRRSSPGPGARSSSRSATARRRADLDPAASSPTTRAAAASSSRLTTPAAQGRRSPSPRRAARVRGRRGPRENRATGEVVVLFALEGG